MKRPPDFWWDCCGRPRRQPHGFGIPAPTAVYSTVLRLQLHVQWATTDDIMLQCNAGVRAHAQCLLPGTELLFILVHAAVAPPAISAAQQLDAAQARVMVSKLHHVQTPVACLACLYLLGRRLTSQRDEPPPCEAGGCESLTIPKSTCSHRHRSSSATVSPVWVAVASDLCRSSSGLDAGDRHRQALPVLSCRYPDTRATSLPFSLKPTSASVPWLATGAILR